MTIPGLTQRELLMLLSMVMIAALFSVLNYKMTKIGLKCTMKPRSVFWKAVYGGTAGFIVWLVTMSGSVPHEIGLGFASTAGWAAEKTISVYVNSKVIEIDNVPNKGPKVPEDGKQFPL